MRKSILLIALLLMAVPVLAVPTVTITVTDDDVNCVTVSYVVVDSNDPVRAFGLTLITDGNGNIVKATPEDPNYRIYPGQIDIEGGEVVDYGTPYDGDDLGDANLAIEMGSLYTFDANYAGDANAGYGMKPGMAGTLLKFYVDGEPNTVCYDVNEDTITGGVVMEDPCVTPTVIITDGGDGCIVREIPPCYAGMDDYDQWVEAGEPNCWCYPRQCHGDADGIKHGSSWVGYWYVGQPDLDIMAAGWLEKDPPKGSGILGLKYNGVPVACADFDHQKHGSSWVGYWRIGQPDLDEMALYWLEKEPNKGSGTPADCLPGNCDPVTCPH